MPLLRQACVTALLLTVVGASSRAQDASAPGALASPRRLYRADASVAFMHLTSVDESLSPERFGGSGMSFAGNVSRASATNRLSFEGRVGVASSLTTSRNAGGLPDVRAVVLDGRVDVQRRTHVLDGYRASLLIGVAVTGRYGERTYRVAPPTRGTPAENRGQDGLSVLQPTAELSHRLGQGVLRGRLGVGVVGAVWHAWAPIGSLDQAPRVQTIPSLVQLDDALVFEVPVGTHGTWGVSYRQQLLRSRASLLLAESRHEVQMFVGWRRGGAL